MSKALFAWLCFSNVVIAFIVGIFYLDNPFIYSLKDIPYYLFFGFGLFNWVAFAPYNVSRNVIPIFVLFAYLMCNYIAMPVGLVGLAAALRQLVGFFLIYYATIGVARNISLSDFIRFTQKLAIAIIIISWAELAFGLWKSDVIQQYFKAKSIGVLSSGYPFHFFEPLKEPFVTMFGTESIVRATSVFLDPINLGHMLVFWIVTSLFLSIPKNTSLRYIFVVICTITLITTFSKGAWLQLALCLGVFSPMISRKVRILAMIAITAIIIVAFKYVPGGIIHFIGFYSGIKSGGLTGQGLGMVGNYAVMLGSALDLGVGDSFWGTLIGQIGFLGAFLYVWALSGIYRQLPANSIMRALLVSQLIVATLSENAFNISSIFGLAMACAIQALSSKREYVFIETNGLNVKEFVKI